MNYDYNKIVNFLFGKEIKALNSVIEEVINSRYTLIDVNTKNKMFLLNEKNTNTSFILEKRGNGILIAPDLYSNLNFSDNFIELTEVSINENNGDAIVSKIFKQDDKLVAFTTSWHYSNDSYTEAINKMMIINSDDIEKISDRYTIETFLKSFYEKRKGIFSDLYWDMDLLTKNIFIDAKRIERININNGNADKFDVIYNKYLKIVTDAVNKSR